MLDHTQVLPYLIDQRLMPPEALVRHPIRITRPARRNQNYLVTGAGDGAFFLKQGSHDGDVGSIANEAAAYEALQSPTTAQNKLASQLASYLPRFHGYDRHQRVLVVEGVPHSEDMQEYHTSSGRFPRTLARQMGKALGLLHASTRHWTQNPPFAVPPSLPTVFRLARPPLDLLRSISRVGIRLLKLLQRDAVFREGLEQLKQQWQAATLIHGDVKLANFLAFRKHATGRVRGVKLIDWEFAGMGDPRWDVGGVFASYLNLWVLSVPITSHEHPDQLLHLARYPLQRWQGFVQTFWSAYCQTRSFNETDRRQCLLGAIRYAGASLLQNSYAYSRITNFLSNEVTCLAQLGLNVMQRPEAACEHLLGLAGNPS